MTKVLDACRHPDTPLTVTSTLMTAFELAQNGLSIAVLPCYLATKCEELVQVVKADPKFNWDIWLLSHPDLRRNARVHAFFQFAADEIASVLNSQPSVP